LKLYGVSALEGVGRAAGPGTIPENDWWAEYQDWLVANQGSPGSVTGGFWSTIDGMYWSCCDNDTNGITAIAELILSPVALIRPSILLLSATATTKAAVGALASVRATAKTEDGGLVAGATISFTVLQGPNAGMTGTAVTNGDGDAVFSYASSSHGVDKIQASITELTSPIIDVVWKRLPIFTSPVRHGTRPGRSLTFAVQAVDPDGVDAVSITAGPIPAGAAFNPATRVFEWPNSGGMGPVVIEFTAQYTGYPTPTPSTQTVVIGNFPNSHALDPNNPDSDGDGFTDGQERAANTDPLNPASKPGSF
jgi:hypothetical protein